MQSRVVEIPLNKLVPSEANVRKTNRMIGVEELAANIAARGGQIIQSLAVRPVRNEAGEETGVYRVPAGGRRLAALKLLAKRKVIAKTAPIPCIVSEDDEEELSLSENVMREPLHPADQFEAFKLFSERGDGEEEIGARFGVSAHVVRQRLRLAVVSPVLIQRYRDGGLTLDQLMAFTVTEDHERQEQVYALLPPSREPYLIRRMLTETQVPARDRRAVFVGVEAYSLAGGAITRDLFTDDRGGWFGDASLLDKLAAEKLQGLADDLQVREGWKWVEAFLDYPDAHGLRRIYPRARELSAEDQVRLDGFTADYERIAAEWEQAEEVPDEISDELDALSAEIAALNALAYAFDPEDIARSGAFVILDYNGGPRVETGFLRPEDDVRKTETEDVGSSPSVSEAADAPAEVQAKEPTAKLLSDALIQDLTAHRTLALRFVLGEQPETVLIGVVHALTLSSFYGSMSATCLDITSRSRSLRSYAAGIDETVAGRGLTERHKVWAGRLPEDEGAVWSFVVGLSPPERLALLAHCVALTVVAVREPWDRSGRGLAAADALAQATGLDMSAYWKPTASSYFGRVTKAQIVEAVREVVSDEAARRIEGLAKSAMAEAAETLLAETAWLPPILRTAANRNEDSAAAG